MSQENNFIPNQKDYCKLRPFQLFMKHNFPFIENTYESLDIYGLLCEIVKYLNNVIANENIVTENQQALYDAFVELNTYVSNYFDNLDVQEEINNKLDDMVEAGTLQEIITEYLNSKAIFGFDNIEAMKEATNLIEGSYAKTLGYFEINDEGESLFRITDEIPSSYYITLNSGLYAELIESKELNIKQFGAKGNGTDNDSNAFINAMKYINSHDVKTLKLNDETYLLEQPIVLEDSTKLIGNKSNITISENYTSAKIITSKSNISNIEIKNINITLDDTLQLTSEGNITRGLIALENVNGVKIDNVHLENIYEEVQTTEAQPIWLQSCSNIEIKNSYIKHYGLEYSGKGNGIWIFSRLGTVENVEISNNYLEGYGDELIALYAGNYDYAIKNVNIFNNTFVSYGNMGIAFPSVGNVLEKPFENINIENNYFKGASITLSQKIYNITINNNEFEDNSDVSYTPNITSYITSVYIASSTSNYNQLKIINNKILTSLYNGISLQPYFKNIIVANNKIIASSLLQDKTGITVQGNDSLVFNNVISYYDLGIQINNVIVYENVINNCTNGIITRSISFNIHNNKLNNCSYGININNNVIDNSYILDNNFYKNTTRAILCSVTMNSVKVLIKGNTDYFEADSQRNLVEVTGTLRANLFENYKYRTAAYSWITANDLDA